MGVKKLINYTLDMRSVSGAFARKQVGFQKRFCK